MITTSLRRSPMPTSPVPVRRHRPTPRVESRETVLIRTPRHETAPATIVDLRDHRAAMCLPDTVEAAIDQLLDVEVDGHWELVRVSWSRPGIRETIVCGIEFLDRTESG